MKKTLLGAIALGLLGVGLAVAQTPYVPQVQSIGPTDLFQDVVGGNPQAASYYAPANMLANYAMGQPGNNPENALIGGDASTNLFDYGTTGSSVTTTVTYGGPDRWAYWSGASTAMTVSRDSTAGDLPTGAKYAFKMARTSGQTGVVQVCKMQEVESVNSYQFAGQTAELDFHAVTGANFSPTNGNIQAYIITGTGTDDGVAGSASGAYGLNGGGGGSVGWAGQVNWAATIAAGVSSSGRYSIVAPIPVGTTEIGVAICFTPTGTAGTNDYVALSLIQLVRNSALTPLVAANASGTATALAVNDTRAKAFSRRTQALETTLQERYYWIWNETVSSTANSPFICTAQSSTVAVCTAVAHTPFRTAPTITCTVGTLKRMVAGTDTTVSACAAAATTNGVSGVDNVTITATVASGDTAGFSGTLMSGNSTGGGKVTASAEL
jgi:hypothetical protein